MSREKKREKIRKLVGAIRVWLEEGARVFQPRVAVASGGA